VRKLNATAIILAGGKSSRMGTNKALLKLNGKTVIENITETLEHVVDEIIIVTNTFSDYEFLHLPMVEDTHKGLGPLAGIEAGLTSSNTERNLVVACDMPFISAGIAKYLLSCLKEYQIVVPMIYGRLHPLFGAYRKEVKDAASQTFAEKRHSIIPLLNKVKTKIVMEDSLQLLGLPNKELYFFNMNNPSDYQSALIFSNNKNASLYKESLLK